MDKVQLIFVIVWIITAMPMVGVYEWIFNKYDPVEPDSYEVDMRSIYGIVWFVTLIPVICCIVIKKLFIRRT